jgi:ABC-type glycerol-3-phosphate transport system substrate-binding protein
MKKLHKIGLFTVILLLLFTAGCGTGKGTTAEEGQNAVSNSETSETNTEIAEEEPPAEPEIKKIEGEIKLLRAWGNVDQFQKLVEDFNKDYPDIKVEIMEQTYTELPALLGAGIVPDVVGMVGTMPEWVENGILEDLTKYVETDPDVNPDTFYEVAYTRSITPDGKLWGLPWLVDPNFAIAYNKTVFDEYGVDGVPDFQSLQELGDFLKQFWVVRNGEQVMTTYRPHDETYNPVNALQTYSYLNGATTSTFYDPETRKVSFNDPKIVEALEWIVRFKRENIDDDRMNQLNATLPEGMNRFQAGKAALMIQTAGDLRGNYELMGDEIGMVPMPEQAIWAGGWSFGMTAGSENKDAAWEFLKWISATDAGAASTLKHFNVVSGKKENPSLDEQAKTDPIYAVFKEVLEKAKHGHLWTWIPVAWTDEYVQKIAAVYDGSMEPKAFLDHMTNYIQQLIDEKYGSQ